MAAASIGQVHRATDAAGRQLAVKVQFPGVREAIKEDLDAAELMYAMFSALALNGLDAKALVDELRARMNEELDYRLEAANLTEFADAVRRPPVGAHPDASRPSCRRAACSPREWVEGMSWDQFVASASPATKQRVGRGDLALRPGLGAAPRHVQRRPPPRQLPLPPRRQRHVPRLRPGEALGARRVAAPRADARRDRGRP